MPYYEEGSLEEFVKQVELSPKDYDLLLRGILEGLGFLHENGYIHRDFKPSNALIAREHGMYVPKLADFGLGKEGASIEKSSLLNSAIGMTLTYAAPEQLTRDKIRPNVDLWGFGVLLYKLQTGELPFRSSATETTQKEAELRRQITKGELPEGLSNIAEPYQSIIRRCLVVDRKKRVQSAEELLGLLAGSGGTSGGEVEDQTIVIPEPTPGSKPQPKGKESDKRRWLLLLLPLLLLLGGLPWWNPFGGGASEEASILADSVGQELVIDTLGVDSTGLAEEGKEAKPAPTPKEILLQVVTEQLEQDMVYVQGGRL